MLIQLRDDDFAALRVQDLVDEEIFEVLATADLFMSISTYTDSVAVEIDQL
jgi:hypothetical protein